MENLTNSQQKIINTLHKIKKEANENGTQDSGLYDLKVGKNSSITIQSVNGLVRRNLIKITDRWYDEIFIGKRIESISIQLLNENEVAQKESEQKEALKKRKKNAEFTAKIKFMMESKVEMQEEIQELDEDILNAQEKSFESGIWWDDVAKVWTVSEKTKALQDKFHAENQTKVKNAICSETLEALQEEITGVCRTELYTETQAEFSVRGRWQYPLKEKMENGSN